MGAWRIEAAHIVSSEIFQVVPINVIGFYDNRPCADVGEVFLKVNAVRLLVNIPSARTC